MHVGKFITHYDCTSCPTTCTGVLFVRLPLPSEGCCQVLTLQCAADTFMSVPKERASKGTVITVCLPEGVTDNGDGVGKVTVPMRGPDRSIHNALVLPYFRAAFTLAATSAGNHEVHRFSCFITK